MWFWVGLLLASGLLAKTPEVRAVEARAAGRYASPMPFLAVAVEWSGEESPRLRASVDGLEWTAWKIADPDPHAERPSALLFFDFGMRLVEIDRAAPGTRLHFIDPGEERLAPRSVVERDALARPRIVSRAEWGAPEPFRGTPAYTTVTHLIVHHTADGPVANEAAWLRAIWAYHVNVNGWSDVGYNYLIGPSGTIFVGRDGGDNVLGAHFSCQNSNTLGVALLGTFSRERPPAAAFDALAQLLAWRADALRLPATGVTRHPGMAIDLPVIASHRDGNDSPRSCTRTECPGDALYAQLPELRQRVAALVGGSQGWQAAPGSLWRVSSRRGSVAAWWYGNSESGTYDLPGLAHSGWVEMPEVIAERDLILNYASWYETEDEGLYFDRKLVEVSVDGGAWRLVDQVSGPMQTWVDRRVVLTGLRGRVRVRFLFETVDAVANQHEGWYVDRVRIE
jgi:hypothetical protein